MITHNELLYCFESVQGLKFLLDNRLSHPLLKSLLGNLKDLIHDSSEKVRIAFLDVLVTVKGMKAIKVCEFFPEKSSVK